MADDTKIAEYPKLHYPNKDNPKEFVHFANKQEEDDWKAENGSNKPSKPNPFQKN